MKNIELKQNIYTILDIIKQESYKTIHIDINENKVEGYTRLTMKMNICDNINERIDNLDLVEKRINNFLDGRTILSLDFSNKNKIITLVIDVK